MTEKGEKALLPAGMVDLLPPEAAQESAAISRILDLFSACGYQRVKPPMLEFEETLFDGAGAALSQQTFRLMDPLSQRMMGLRADMTTQVVRIAATRLSGEPRPLRLCYAGQVLRVKGNQLRNDRQIAQVGAELIGSESSGADAEIIALAASALEKIGVTRLSVDIALPTLVPAIARTLGLSPSESADLREALDRKDAAAVKAISKEHGKLLSALLRAAGPVERAVAALSRLTVPEDAQEELERLLAVVERLRELKPDLRITVDPTEHRGFEYQTGVSFAFFARGVRGELGRGGRYAARAAGGCFEPATGVTLYMDSLLRALPEPDAPSRVYLPAGHDPKIATALREKGFVTLAGHDPVEEDRKEARRMACDYWLSGETLRKVEEN
ncbi:ATP phosphoribosyltransferase regulatory subunit [Limibacillus halophilus]|uniref:ATP phosphoribosyltransferase regulatory subunit n=1 Tax=Limibacillus halophilus TaxID=1579333 RepID=A0A839SR66_9PROT|nr:ATP phosphoribosyltransferase regulatory subunit [Limibacillus halophilus]MBB3064778.1 ATP phosphoribosyltransferase regulatory subunit [Limibacillus halophilus]